MKKIILSIISVISIFTIYAETEIMRIHLSDGTTANYSISEVDSITFAESEPAAEITVSDITLNSARITIKPSSLVDSYTFGVVTKAEYDGFASETEFVESEIEKLRADAESWGFAFEEYLDFILYRGSEGEQTFSREELEPGTEYYAYVFGLTTSGEATTAVVKTLFSTQDLQNVEFNLSVNQLTAKTGVVNAAPDNAELRYYLGFTTKDAYLNSFGGSDEQLRDNALAQVINNMVMGTPFEQVTRQGETSLSMSGLVPGTEYYAIAFGVEAKGTNSAYATTELTKLEFSTPSFEVTDDCTFDIEISNISSMLMDITVTPSDNATRYYATIKSVAETAGKTPEQVADEEIVFQDGFFIDWATTPQVFTGKQTLNSRTDLGVTNLKPETDYTIYVFGVDTEGYRTTAVSTAQATTTAVQTSDMTISFEGIKAGEETDSQNWFKTNYFVEFTPVPSVDNEYYYVALAKKDDYEWATVFGSDEDFIKEVISTAGEGIMLNCFMGRPETPLKAYKDYKGNDLEAGTDYYIIAFGYMGDATTPLFKEAVTTSGTAEDPWF